ncbi:MAG: galactokinase, partial [Anaerolineae bacterium]|nr:galactokinase [Thermoflexales bacterium]MDW8407709.1 galactokinase [Anaerolineae bacterium]
MHLDDYIALFRSRYAAKPTFIGRAPGRVNLIGEHTDYNEGFVLPMAIDRDVTIVGAARQDRMVRIYSADFDQSTEFSLDRITSDTAAPWSNYIRGVAAMLQGDGLTLCGLDGVMSGNVPIASGLSSSAATEMATVMAFCAASGQSIEGVRAARLSQRAENEFVGVQCGIMDQFISSLGKADHALLIDCRSLEYELVPLPAGVSVLVVDTTAPRTLAGSAYNQRRRECEEGARLFGARSLRDVSAQTFEHKRAALPGVIAKRCAHVIYENQRVLDAVAALRRSDIATFGALMNQSHDSLRDLYEVSSAELDAVVEIARDARGVYGARMTGAGFGGCAIALVESGAMAELADIIAVEYPRRTGRTPNLYPCTASEGASWSIL